MAFASDSTTAPARPLLPLLALDRRAIGRDGWARAREIAAQLGGEVPDHVAEGMRQAWAAARGLLPAESTASAPEPVTGATAPLLPLPAPLPPLAAALSRRRVVFGTFVPDTLDAIRADLNAMLGRVDAFAAAPNGSIELDAVEILASEGRALYLRRALERAAEHAAAMLPALGLPRLVDNGFVPLDRGAALDALEVAIAALDALDADPDLEPWLAGTPSPGRPLDVEAEPEHDEDDGSGEPSLASPERHPVVPWGGNHVRHYVTRDRHDTQARWADGGRQDREGEITDEPHDGQDEDLEHEPAEHSLGAPAGDGDQRHWAQGYENDREADPTDESRLVRTMAQCQAARDRRPALNDLARQAREIRGRTRHVPLSNFDPDVVTPISSGMVAWRWPIVGAVSK